MSWGMVIMAATHLTHHPDVRGVSAAVVWDAMTNAGGAVSQDHAAG